MKKEDCRAGLKIQYEYRGVVEFGEIASEDIFQGDDSVWVQWDNGELLHVSYANIEPVAPKEQSITLTELNAMIDFIIESSEDSYKDEWYTTDRSYTMFGLDKLRKYLDEKFKVVDLKQQALSKLTKEEIEALGLNLS